jgi:hypothetical protein
MLNMALQPSFYAILLGSIFPFLRHTDVLFVSRACSFALRVWRYNCYLILFSVPTSSFEKRGPDLFKYIIVLPRRGIWFRYFYIFNVSGGLTAPTTYMWESICYAKVDRGFKNISFIKICIVFTHARY